MEPTAQDAGEQYQNRYGSVDIDPPPKFAIGHHYQNSCDAEFRYGRNGTKVMCDALSSRACKLKHPQYRKVAGECKYPG